MYTQQSLTYNTKLPRLHFNSIKITVWVIHHSVFGFAVDLFFHSKKKRYVSFGFLACRVERHHIMLDTKTEI